jgi:hypothetical protein
MMFAICCDLHSIRVQIVVKQRKEIKTDGKVNVGGLVFLRPMPRKYVKNEAEMSRKTVSIRGRPFN